MSTPHRDNILVVDDTPANVKALSDVLSHAGYRVMGAHDGASALEQARQALPLVILLDVMLPGVDGFEVCRRLKAEAATAEIPVIHMTALANLDDKLKGFAAGGADYVVKPVEPQEVLARVRTHASLRRLQHENRYLRQAVREHVNPHEIVGASTALRQVMHEVDLAAAQGAGAVLIQGESGTGKELIARAIHERSPRRERALIKLDCSRSAPGLVESELFGRSAGGEHRSGYFELAAGGTLFLDAVSELPLPAQIKLLRLLEDGSADVRVIAASNRDLGADVASGRFLADLHRQLSALVIRMPPLRERSEDIPALTQYFLERAARKLGKSLRSVSNETLAALKEYAWPGNIRDLQYTIERAAILSPGETLQLDGTVRNAAGAHAAGGLADAALAGNGGAPIYRLVELERQHFITVLKKTRGVIEGPHGAARLLDLKPSTARFRIKKLGIRREDFDARLAARDPLSER